MIRTTHRTPSLFSSLSDILNQSHPLYKLAEKNRLDKVLDIVRKLKLSLRQSYTFVLKRIYRNQRFRNHPKNRKKHSKRIRNYVVAP